MEGQNNQQQNSEFDFDEYRRLFNDGMLKDNLDAKNYILKFFCPLTTGQHALIEKNEISIIAKDTMREVYMERWDDKIKKWYKKETNPKKVICDFHKPMIGDRFINVSKQLKHEYKEYKTFDDKIKNAVEGMLSYLKEVWANSDDDMYKYLLNWLSTMVKGGKNKSCLYLKSIEGVGKSTLTDFLRDYVMGLDICLKGKADHLKGQHSLPMMGKLLVVFEELQIFNSQEWYAIDAELKDLITDDIASYTDKYEKRIQTTNTNNYIINTNFDLKGAHGRRMCVLEINTKYLNNFEYFDKLRKECFNNIVGQAFYCYLKEIDTTNYQSHIIPETQTKRNIYLHLLPPQEKFLKKYFVLRHAGIKMKTSALYKLYEESEFWKQGMNAHNFHSHLRELGFTEANKFKKIKDGYDIYDITYDQLLEFGKKRKWFDKSDIEIQQELKEADIEDDDKIYVDKRKYLETDERLRKMESKIKLLSEFVEIQSTYNHKQKIRNKQMIEFNEIIKNYENIKSPQKKLVQEVKVDESKTKMINEIVQIQSEYNEKKQLRNEQLDQFKEITSKYDELKTVKDNQDNKEEELTFKNLEDLNEFVK